MGTARPPGPTNSGGESIALYEILRHLPVVAAAAWFTIAGMQARRDRYHTWTEVFFLFACVFAGLYAVGDWLLFNATDDSGAAFGAVVSLTSINLASLFFLLFTLVYIGKMRPVYWALTGPSLALIVAGPVVMLTGVIRPGPGELYLPTFDPTAFGIFLAYIVVTGVLGVVNLARLHRIVRSQSKVLARRTAGLLVTFTAVVFLGLTTNGYLGITRNTQIPPLFSTLLIFVAGGVMVVLFPGGRERVSVAVRQWQASRYNVKAAFLIYQDGTLIGAKSQPGEVLIDNDLLTATLDVIHNYTRTSFPMLHVRWLKAVSFGDYILVTERVRSAYLTILLEGEESEQLRRQMRDLLREFEWRNYEVLTKWRGVPSEALGVDDLLSHVIAQEREEI